jgi:hypothetical protein
MTMNGQNFEERVYTSENVEPTDERTDNLVVVDTNAAADEALQDAALTHEITMDETTTHETPLDTVAGSPAALLSPQDGEHFRARWIQIQGKFVDEPRSAVQQADALVSEVIEQITQMFAKEHGLLEGQWKQGKDVSTEDLRQALQHYRSFFNRLVA